MPPARIALLLITACCCLVNGAAAAAAIGDGGAELLALNCVPGMLMVCLAWGWTSQRAQPACAWTVVAAAALPLTIAAMASAGAAGWFGGRSSSTAPLGLVLAPLLVIVGPPVVVITGIIASLRWPEPNQTEPLCPHCGYNLTGNVSGICSECGTKIENAPPNNNK